MALNANDYKQESNFKRPDPLEAGTYPGRVVQIISLGLQPQRPFKGEEKPPKHEIRVTYELVDEFLQDEDGKDIEDKPWWIAENFTMNSLDSDLAKSTKRYYALDPKGVHKGDWSKLVGAPCMITVIQNKSKQDDTVIYNNIASNGVNSMRPKEAANLPDLKNEPKVFDVDEPDLEVFLSLPKFVQDLITEKNLEFDGSVLQRMLAEHGGEDVAPKEKKAVSKRGDVVTPVEISNSGDSDDEDW